jgi:uncharacterized membrane protein
MKKKMNVEQLIMTALLTALVAVATIAIPIPVPFTNGYIHPGDSMIFLAVLISGWKRGAVAAGVGSAFADIFLGYVFWAPWTLVIKGCMAMITGLFISKCTRRRRDIAVSCVVVIVLWLLFNAAVQGIVLYEAKHSAAALIDAMGEEITDSGALGATLAFMQARLMAVALLIPAGLLAITFALRKKENIAASPGQILGMTGGGLFMVFGYYVAGGLIYGNFAVSAFSIPANMFQFTGGFLIASLLSAALQKTPAGKYFAYAPHGEESPGTMRRL